MTIEHFFDYGPRISSKHESTNQLAAEFSFSFYKLTGHPWISMTRIDEWDEIGKFLSTSYQASYTSCYSPGEDFSSWWDKTFEFSRQDHALGSPNDDIYDLILNHYKSFLETIT